jgi:hypothetical protein
MRLVSWATAAVTVHATPHHDWWRHYAAGSLSDWQQQSTTQVIIKPFGKGYYDQWLAATSFCFNTGKELQPFVVCSLAVSFVP